ncbi:MAG: flagellar filament capping protein FliD [Lachnospiraceae bacterium]|nr:flagellar filament capping protein FliD [Lachnospiraceae bacterium]
MAGYNFFSGMLGSANNSGTSIWSMYSSLGDYNSIKSGSYHKLLKSYYNETKSEDTTKKNDSVKSALKNKNVDSVTKKEMNTIKQSTDELQKSAATLLEKGSKSVYGEDNKDKLVSAVKNFVTDYNNVIDKAGDSSSEKVLSKTLSMVNNTKAYSKSLEEIGITVGKDNKLSVDEEKLKNANSNTVKGMLQAGNSFAGQTLQKAAQIGAAAQNVSTGASLYGGSGSYTYQNVNSFFDSYL